MPPKRRVKGGVRLSKILNKGAEDAMRGTNLRLKKLMYNRSDGTYRVLYENAEGKERSTEKIKGDQLKSVSGLTEVRPREYEIRTFKGDEALRNLFGKYIGESEAAASAPPPAAAAAAAEAPEPEPEPAPAPVIKVRRIVRRKEAEEESEEEERAAKAKVRMARPAASATVASTASPAVPRELLPAVSGPATGSRAVREKVASAPVREKMTEIATERVQRASAETVEEEAVASAITESHAPPPVFERRDVHAKKERKEMDAADELADIAEGEEVPEETIEEYERTLTEYDVYGYRITEPDLPDEPSAPSASESVAARQPSARMRDLAHGAVVVDRFGRPEPPGEASSSGLARRLASGSSAIGFRREEITEQDRAESRVRIIASILDLTEQGDLSVAHRLEIATRFGRPINAMELRELGRQILVARQEKLRRLAAKGFRTMSRTQMRKALSKL